MSCLRAGWAAFLLAGACATSPVPPSTETVRAADVGAWWPCAPEKLQITSVPGFTTCLDDARYRDLLSSLGTGGGASDTPGGDGLEGPDPRPFIGHGDACAVPFEVHGCMQRQVFLCHGGGLCAPLTERTAYAESDAECRSLGQCKRFGECALGPDHGCRANAEADCQASTEACAIMGRCQLDPRGLCVAEGAAACAGAVWCRDLGRCQASDGTCIAGDAAGCRASTECRTRQRCWPRDGICVNEPPPH